MSISINLISLKSEIPINSLSITASNSSFDMLYIFCPSFYIVYYIITNIKVRFSPSTFYVDKHLLQDQRITTLFFLVTDECFDIFQFDLQTENCPPFVPQGFSPNGDSKNDFFNIQGLYDIFENHELLIYNRYGKLIFKGNNNLKWHGQTNQGILAFSDVLPTGTYFYVLKLHDPKYDDLVGWVYLNK